MQIHLHRLVNTYTVHVMSSTDCWSVSRPYLNCPNVLKLVFCPIATDQTTKSLWNALYTKHTEYYECKAKRYDSCHNTCSCRKCATYTCTRFKVKNITVLPIIRSTATQTNKHMHILDIDEFFPVHRPISLLQANND